MAKRRKPDDRRFVQTDAGRLSLGVEVTTGRPWVGVDQQVGHGSADALFALDDEVYSAALADPTALGTYPGECWRGEHGDQALFRPAMGGGRPDHWHPLRNRMLPPRVAGELWWHLDALAAVQNGAGTGDEHLAVSRALAADRATIEGGPGEVVSMTLDLCGTDAYPRPAAVIADLDATSDRTLAEIVLGDPVVPDTYAVEGDLIRLRFADDHLAAITLERPAPRPAPPGPVGTILAAVGTAEAGPEFAAVAALAGGGFRRWAVSSSIPRRLLDSGRGVQVQVDRGGVLSARLEASALADQSLGALTRPEAVHDLLGPPADSHRGLDLYRFGSADLVVEYSPPSLTAVRWGTSVSHTIGRWKSGEFTLFLDVLGRPVDDPLTALVRGLEGVRVSIGSGLVTAVEIGKGLHRDERFAAFVDGTPARPTRGELGLGFPDWFGDRDDLYLVGGAYVHVHAGDGITIAGITVSQEEPRTPALRALPYHRRGEWPPTR